MQEKKEKEELVIKLLKVFFSIIAITSIIFVFYNITVYTNSQDMEVSAGLENGL